MLLCLQFCHWPVATEDPSICLLMLLFNVGKNLAQVTMHQCGWVLVKHHLALSGQSYTLISIYLLLVGLLVTLQSMIKTIAAQVKALEKLISGRVAWSSCIVSNIGKGNWEMKSIFPTGLILYKVGCDLLMNHVSPSSWTFLNSGLSISSCEPQLTPSSCEPGSWAAVYRYQNMCLCHIYNMLHAFVLSFRYIVFLVTGTCSPNSWASNINPGNIWFYLIFYLNFIYRRSIGSCEPWFTAKVHGSWALNHEPWPWTLMIWLTRHQITANPNTVGDRLD